MTARTDETATPRLDPRLDPRPARSATDGPDGSDGPDGPGEDAPDARDPRRAHGRDLLLGLQAALAVAVAGVVAWLSVRLAGAPAAVGFDDDGGWTEILLGLVLVGTGSVVLRGARQGRSLGVVLLVDGWLWLVTALASLWVVERLTFSPDLPGAPLALDLVLRWGALILFGLPLVLLLFPTGRLPRKRPWRAVAVVSLALTAVLPLLVLVVPSQVADAGAPVSPDLAALHLDLFSLPLSVGAWPVLRGLGLLAALLGMVAAFAVLGARYRGSRGVRRLQMRWLLWAGVVDVAAIGPAFGAPQWVQEAALSAAVVLTAVAVMVAVTRYRLYEIDRLLPTTLVAVGLGALVLAVDGVVLLVAGAVFSGRDATLLAVAVVAVLYTPLRNRLWRAARRVVRGGRDDPYGAMSTLAGRLESAAAPGEQLAALARSVAEAFRLPYVRVEIDRADGARAVVEHGEPTGPPVTLPVSYRGETIGRVVVSGGARLSEGDQRLLGDLLRQAAAAARAGALGASLQRTREALVTAREEERRRLRRDLHDSIGPGLAAVTLRIETARALAEVDAGRSDAALVTATEDVAALLADVRRLVHDLRPPALDELGLAAALAQLAERLDGGVRVDVRVDAGGGAGTLGALPAAVEVAAYRIVAEALTNVVRHAAAGRATVTLRRTPAALEVEVVDDGCGIEAAVPAGVGTLSLRERAAELGGRTTVSCPATGGTVVASTLPLDPLAPSGEDDADPTDGGRS